MKIITKEAYDSQIYEKLNFIIFNYDKLKDEIDNIISKAESKFPSDIYRWEDQRQAKIEYYIFEAIREIEGIDWDEFNDSVTCHFCADGEFPFVVDEDTIEDHYHSFICLSCMKKGIELIEGNKNGNS